jgi:tetraacyldisaccharide 4'-kinase
MRPFSRLLQDWLRRRWYAPRLAPGLWPCLPLAGLFAVLAALRRCRYRAFPPRPLPVPVLVVGNLTVGGAGKTPLTLALAQSLAAAGWRPGIVSRGHGGKEAKQGPRPVLPDSTPREVGDEPLLLARRSRLPVWVGRDRRAAGAALLAAHPEVDLILCDDGLQHYRLARDLEIAVFDGRGAGNGWPLPAGPMREPLSRLALVDAIVHHGDPDLPFRSFARPTFAMTLAPGDCYRLADPSQHRAVADFRGQRLHAVAGMGNPERFFQTLASLGLEFTPHPFPDHHPYRAADLAFPRGETLLMTEKDAVKCARFDLPDAWVLPVDALLPAALLSLARARLAPRPFPGPD